MAAAEIQPSDDYNATSMAIAWSIVQGANYGDNRETDPEKIALLVRKVYGTLVSITE